MTAADVVEIAVEAAQPSGAAVGRVDGRDLRPAGSAAEGPRGSIDGRDLRPAGSAAEGPRGSIDGRDLRPAGSAAEGPRGSIDGRDLRPAGSAAEGRREHTAVLPGRRVLVPPFDPCGECDVCRRGGAAVCPRLRRREPVGARLLVPSRWLVALEAGLELPVPAAAAIAGDVTTAYTLYARTGLGPREPVVVTGATAVTRFLVEILIAKAITPTVVATDGAWGDWLLAKGAAVVRDDADLHAAVAAAIAAQGLGARPWRVIATDPTDRNDASDRAARLAGPRATLTVLATPPPVALPGELLAREVVVIGVAGPHPDLIVEAAAMCVKGEIDLVGGVTMDASDRTRAMVMVAPP